MGDIRTVVSQEKLTRIKALLTALGAKNKLSSDGLGCYLGDGIPRPGLGELRSNELLSAVEELEAKRLEQKQDFEWALDALIEALGELNAGHSARAKMVLREALWSKLA